MKRLAAEIARPVSSRDAQRFATITALAAGLPYVVMVLAAVVSEGGTAFLAPLDLRSPQSSSNPSLLPPAADLQVPYVAGMTRWPVLPLAIVMFTWLCTRVTPWFLRRAGERAEALGYYTSAALVLPLIATAFVIAGLGTLYVHSSRPGGGAGGSDDWMLYATFGTGSALVVLGFALWWINVLSLQRRIAQPTLRRMIWTALGVPAAWYACALVSFMFFPWLAGLLWLMYESVRG
jgi:hypothetical protein